MRDGEGEIENDDDYEHLHNSHVVSSSAFGFSSQTFLCVLLFDEHSDTQRVQDDDDNDRDDPANDRPYHQINLVITITVFE